MKKLYLMLLLFLLCTKANCEAKIPIKILKIYDGDTVYVQLNNGNKFSLRLIGIDCYETSKIHRAYRQAYEDNIKIETVIEKGKDATNYLKTLHKKSNDIFFDLAGIDKYGRALGVLYFNNTNINELLLKENYCKPYD